jgi:hypothetical protein
MKLSPRKPSSKLVVHAATALTGAVALTAAAAPAAYANPAAINPAVPHPYKLWVLTASSVRSLNVCGWKSDSKNGHPYCTVFHTNPSFGIETKSLYMGSGWKDGSITIDMVSGGRALASHHCNTNGSYYGHFRSTVSPQGDAVSHGVVLTHSGGTFLGDKGAAEC